MITEHEQNEIRLRRDRELYVRKEIQLRSDTELYAQAVEFMRGIAKQLPPTQINGLLNVSLANTYSELEGFVEHQRTRTTWRREDLHIPEFYKRLKAKLKQLEGDALSIIKAGKGLLSPEDLPTLKMLLAHEFIQHVLAENAYIGATKTVHNADQGRPQGNNRGPVTRQRRA